MRYTYYENKDYSTESWLDAFVTVLALEGVTSLLRFLFNFPLYGFSAYLTLQGIDILGEQVFAIVSSIVILAVTVYIEALVCKIRYPGLPYYRVISYLLIPKVIIFALSYFLMANGCAF
jgi:hypothetical protein